MDINALCLPDDDNWLVPCIIISISNKEPYIPGILIFHSFLDVVCAVCPKIPHRRDLNQPI